MKDYTSNISSYIDMEIAAMKNIDINAVSHAINVLEEARARGSTIYVCGNGGSASTASHLAGDFTKGINEHVSPKYNVISLSDNVSSMMAIANDSSYEEIFSFPLTGRLKPGDILIAISGSGNSGNIIRAVKYAKECGNLVIGLTGYSGGRLRELADISLHVAVGNMQIAEDLHLMIEHVMMSCILSCESYGWKGMPLT